jgi:hypothetical protein
MQKQEKVIDLINTSLKNKKEEYHDSFANNCHSANDYWMVNNN